MSVKPNIIPFFLRERMPLRQVRVLLINFKPTRSISFFFLVRSLVRLVTAIH